MHLQSKCEVEALAFHDVECRQARMSNARRVGFETMHSLRALRLVSWGALALAVIGAAAVYLVRPTLLSGSLPAIEIKGQAQVGGPFTAVDQAGRRVTERG